MRIDVTRAEFEIIVDCLKGQGLRCYDKQRQLLALQLDWQLHPNKRPDSDGWAPMRKKVSIKSGWPSNTANKDKKPHWSFNKPPRAPKPKAVKKPLTADDIIAEL